MSDSAVQTLTFCEWYQYPSIFCIITTFTQKIVKYDYLFLCSYFGKKKDVIYSSTVTNSIFIFLQSL